MRGCVITEHYHNQVCMMQETLHPKQIYWHPIDWESQVLPHLEWTNNDNTIAKILGEEIELPYNVYIVGFTLGLDRITSLDERSTKY